MVGSLPHQKSNIDGLPREQLHTVNSDMCNELVIDSNPLICHAVNSVSVNVNHTPLYLLQMDCS